MEAESRRISRAISVLQRLSAPVKRPYHRRKRIITAKQRHDQSVFMKNFWKKKRAAHAK